jgi:hypothetical protein
VGPFETSTNTHPDITGTFYNVQIQVLSHDPLVQLETGWQKIVTEAGYWHTAPVK